MLFFADSGERAVVQALLMGIGRRGDHDDAAAALAPRQPVPRRASVAFNRWRWSGRCEIIDQELAVAGVDVSLPCDAAGNQI